jgi:hypothetical protein
MIAEPTVHSEEPAGATDQDAWKLFVFRKRREAFFTEHLLAALRWEIRSLANGSGSALDALVRAGEIETGLEDAGAGSREILRVGAVVDTLAALACRGARPDPSSLLDSLDHLRTPATIACSHPEGFSYYGLNPLDFADLAARIQAELAPRVAVVGIRSVGSTLGAVVTAELRTHGISVERITVRPAGEPYRRKTVFSPQQQDWLRVKLDQPCDFLVVDEGPGFSGSTFLSVAQALVDSGVPYSRIVLMGSRPFPLQAAGTMSEKQWKQFRSYTIEYASHPPSNACRNLGDGAWRELLYPSRSLWPACWVEQERVKHMSADGRSFFKFEGFGRFGQLAREQALELAQAGLSPRWTGSEHGYACYEFVVGRPLRGSDLNQAQLSRMAEYCAFRVTHFSSTSADLAILGAMTRNNLEVEFGTGFKDFSIELPLERPVYPDCRMLPHEWLIDQEGRVVKTDGVGHAEGHQLPGPADIAWDLAGAIIEWDLAPAARAFLLEEYRRRTGDAAGNRLRPYLLLYSVLRMSQCRMSSVSMARRREGKYLRRQYTQYREKVKELVKDFHD